MVMAYSPYNSIILNNDQDNRVGATQISPRDFGMTRKLSFQRGALWVRPPLSRTITSGY